MRAQKFLHNDQSKAIIDQGQFQSKVIFKPEDGKGGGIAGGVHQGEEQEGEQEHHLVNRGLHTTGVGKEGRKIVYLRGLRLSSGGQPLRSA